jgi:hypothetical protein
MQVEVVAVEQFKVRPQVVLASAVVPVAAAIVMVQVLL